MNHLPDLFPVVAEKVLPPVLIVLGSPWPATQLVQCVGNVEVDCYQMDVYQAGRLREKLTENSLTATVHVAADLWDLPKKYRTAIFPAAARSDRDLKIDMVEQGFHVLEEGGRFITLSEYEKDTHVAKWHKKVFGKCGESPKSKNGMAFWSTKTGEQERRRHGITFHSRIGDGASMSFDTWPGTFSYGRMDNGSRAMLEVVQIEPGARVLDLGCGNGSVGCLAAPLAGPTGEITFVDSNARAVALAEHNAKANGVANYRLMTTADLGELEAGYFDVVLANPPYYANSEVARLFILTARDALKPGGRFYLVSKMPVQTIPEVVDIINDVETVENRSYTVIIGRA